MEVVCLVYDLSHGMARTMSATMVGMQIDLVPHTGILVFGHEYFFGGGIQRLPEGKFASEYNQHPVERLSLGTTPKTQTELHAWLETVRTRFSQNTYDLVENNCNNFSDVVAKFLLGDSVGVPAHIIELPQKVLNTPLGQMLAPMFQNMQTQMQAHIIPFNQPDRFETAAGAVATNTAITGPDAGVIIPVKISSKNTTAQCCVVSYESTLGNLMAAIERETGYAIADQRLILKGQMLKETNKTLAAYGITPDMVVHLVPKPNAVPRGSDNTAVAAATAETPTDPLETSIAKMKNAPAKDLKIALKTLQKIVENVVDQPLEEKYRKIKRTNPALSKRLDHVPGTFDCLLAVGFVEGGDESERLLLLEASEEAWTKILHGNKRLKEELAKANAPAATAIPPANPFLNMFGRSGDIASSNSFAEMGGAAGMPPLPPGMDANMMSQMMTNPMVRQQMTAMLSDPAIMQQMLNSPMMQQMTANNPQMAAQMQAVAANPSMMAEMFNNPMVQSMINNPAMMQGMMGGNAGGGTGNRNGSGEQNDSQMSEEEMIQEAIRRSLQDQ